MKMVDNSQKLTSNVLKFAAGLDEARCDGRGDGFRLVALARDVGDGAVVCGGALGYALDGTGR